MQQNEHSFRLPLHHNPAEVTTMSMTDDDALFMTIQPGSDNAGQPLEDFFDAFYDRRQLCASDRPLRDAAIALIDLGAPREAMLTAWHVSWHRQITTTLASAAEGLDAGFDIASIVLPFRRPVRPIMGSGGDAA